MILDLWFWWLPEAPIMSRATRLDAGDCAELHAGAFHRGWDEATFADMFADERSVAHVIRRRIWASPSGFIVSRVSADEAEILSVVVDASLRGRGYGRLLLAETIRDLRRRAVARLFLEVEAENAAAIKLYEAAGFTRIGKRAAYYRGPSGTHDALTMRLDLPPI